MKLLLAAVALLALSLTPAHADGLHATLEGPAKDGVTYTVRALGDAPEGVLKPWVCADGLMDSTIHSWRMDLKPTADPRVFTFKRTWPKRGDWMLRVNLGDNPPPAPATIAPVGQDGRVGENQRYWKSYGVSECRDALLKIAKEKGIKVDTGC